jgi:dTDP-4-amino-4,6-dideoxygalactose transaminase
MEWKMDKIPWWRTSFGEPELANIREAVLSERISQGPVTKRFEEQFAESLGVPYGVAATSGSASILMALMALGIRSGDEVIVPNRTWIATAHAVLMTGAKAVLADVRPDIPVLDVETLEDKITARTKAVIAVHLNGRATDMVALGRLAAKYGFLVIEDACQALYSRTAEGYLGTLSTAGCFSFAVTKLVSTGQGGMVVTKDPKVYEQLSLVRNHGVTDIFTDSWSQMGFNFKFTDLLASIGLAQLQRAPGRLIHMRAVYQRYLEAMEDLPFLKPVPIDVAGGAVPLYAEFCCPDRIKLVEYLASQNIQTRPVPPSLEISGYIKSGGSFPNSRNFAKEAMYLPCGPEQPLENVDRVIEALKAYRNL